MNVQITLSILVLTCILSGCSKDEPTPSCETNATIINHGNGGSTFCMKASRFNHQISRDNEESYSTYVDLTGLNFTISVANWTLLAEGDNYEPGNPHGAAIYSAQWGSIQHFDLTIEKLDRENQLISMSFRVRATSLNNGATSINYEGFLKDLPLTEQPNP